jgi:hypothetical protein
MIWRNALDGPIKRCAHCLSGLCRRTALSTWCRAAQSYVCLGKSIRLEGFIVANHFNLLPEFQKRMSGWIREGKLSWKETVEHGIQVLREEDFAKIWTSLNHEGEIRRAVISH